MKSITTTLSVCLLTLSATVQAQYHGHHWPQRPQRPHHSECDQCEFKVGQAVLTTSGLVHGHAASNATQVSEYLGIPFAQPPLGDLRFAPPEPYRSRANLSGAAYGNVCPQLTMEAAIPKSLPTTVYNVLCAIGGCGQRPQEDCLTLNVWSKPQSGSAKKPTLVWIYGGAFDTGGTNITAYNGQYFVDQEDVVIVSFKYVPFCLCSASREEVSLTGVAIDLASLGSQELQPWTRTWVRDNIARFGGDPDRITIFGESAGAASVEYYNYAWTKDPIIAGSIAQSGSAFGLHDNNTPEQQAAKWNNLTQTLGCGDSTTQSSEDVLACMRNPDKVSMQALLNKTAAPTGQILAVFGPTIDNKTVFANYTQQSIEGKFIQKPILAGSNENEGGLFQLIALGSGITQPTSYWEALTQNTFTCPSNTQAWARWLHNVPVWRYRYLPSFPNLDIPTSVGRAYHSSEIAVLFGTDQEASGGDSTARERQVGAYMRGAWAAFAHCPATGLAKSLNWPEYSPDVNGTKGLVLLGKENATVATFSARGPWDGTCSLV
nr:para-nitrobenzyl esterase [Quercus suber]